MLVANNLFCSFIFQILINCCLNHPFPNRYCCPGLFVYSSAYTLTFPCLLCHWWLRLMSIFSVLIQGSSRLTIALFFCHNFFRFLTNEQIILRCILCSAFAIRLRLRQILFETRIGLWFLKTCIQRAQSRDFLCSHFFAKNENTCHFFRCLSFCIIIIVLLLPACYSEIMHTALPFLLSRSYYVKSISTGVGFFHLVVIREHFCSIDIIKITMHFVPVRVCVNPMINLFQFLIQVYSLTWLIGHFPRVDFHPRMIFIHSRLFIRYADRIVFSLFRRSVFWHFSVKKANFVSPAVSCVASNARRRFTPFSLSILSYLLRICGSIPFHVPRSRIPALSDEICFECLRDMYFPLHRRLKHLTEVKDT